MNIYVGNLPYGTSQDELRSVFAAFGEVTAARIVTDRETGRSKGFGFVEMSNDDEARSAIEALNGNEIGGRKAVVNEARPREARPKRFWDKYDIKIAAANLEKGVQQHFLLPELKSNPAKQSFTAALVQQNL